MTTCNETIMDSRRIRSPSILTEHRVFSNHVRSALYTYLVSLLADASRFERVRKQLTQKVCE